MNRGRRNRARLTGWDRLETRSLLSAFSTSKDFRIAPSAVSRALAAASAPVVPGNEGQILHSQFQLGPFGEVGAQWWELSVGRPIRVHLVPANLDVPPPVPLGSTINTGNLERSQFNPFGFSGLGSQLRRVRVHGGLTVDVTDETLEPASGPSVGILGGPVNSGDVIHSQFNDSGFGNVGFQMQEVGIGGDFAIHSNQFVRRNIGAAGPLTAAAAAVPTSAASPTQSPSVRPDASINRGLIRDSQFNDGGFGDIGMQWNHVHVGGSVGIGFERWEVGPRATSSDSGPIVTVVSPPNGSIGVSPLVSVTATFSKALDPTTVTTTTFTLQDASGHAVAASVGYNASTHTATLTPSGPLAASMVYTATLHGGASGAVIKDTSGNALPSNFTWSFTTAKANAASENATNIGQILHSQMSDGGFGDIGFQWWGVKVAKDVATSYNTLSIQPKVDNSGPITADGLALGQAQSLPVPSTAQADPATSSSQSIGSGDALASAVASPTAPAVASPGAAVAPAAAAPSLNESTNSGRIFRSQVADGGFGDIGLQWHHVKVHGSVTAVHNSLSVQPENTNQGLITVNNIHFPSQTVPLPPPRRGPRRELPPTPPLIEDDGAPVTTPLPTPTRPFDRTFDINQASNSGNIITSQFADGGFGDFGLQWLDVGVHNNVRMVHNSLSVHPEGNNLAGINVSNVSFGDPVLPPGAPDRIAALRTNLRPSRIVPPVRQLALLAAQASGQHHTQGPDHVNDRLLNHVQLIDVPDAPIVLQWQNLKLHHGLLVINNILLLDLHAGAGPITLNDIRFPGMPPIGATINPAGVAGAQQAGSGSPSLAALRAEGGGTTGAAQVPVASTRSITDQATNSGILVHNQFSGGGFGDIGMQWRNVHVAGPVSVVHNTLSVGVTGSNTGPINISNVVYNSGTLTGGDRPFVRKIIAPPPFYSRVPFFRPDRGTPLPHDPSVSDQATNSGILLGGQFSARGLGHVMLQWRGITVPGPVTVMDNILAITTGDHGSGPITISHVTYA
jgi:hypothetical protein